MPEPGPRRGAWCGSIACGVCRTDLHVVDGELPDPKLPLVPGHQMVGRWSTRGRGRRAVRDRRPRRHAVARLDLTASAATAARGARTSASAPRSPATPATAATPSYAVADERFCMPLPEGYPTAGRAAAVRRADRLPRAADVRRRPSALGLYGFGASAHIVCQVAAHQGREVLRVTRAGDDAAQAFARELGREWAGGAREARRAARRAIIFAPAGELVPAALRALAPGGVVVCAGIHMSDIPSFPYEDLWDERQIRSVANLTRRDGDEFLPLAREAGSRRR